MAVITTGRRAKPFLGPLLLSWCDECNLPIAAGNRCGRCGSTTRRISLTPPGDVRPAFEGDLDKLYGTITNQYGSGVASKLIPKNKVILLNSIPDLDRSDEVILDGRILGLHRFRLDRLSWEFVPKLEGARRLALLTSRKRVVIDEWASEKVAKGANVMAPGVVEADPDIAIGDPVLVVDRDGHLVATGTARMAGEEMKEKRQGLAVRRRHWSHPASPQILLGGQTWKQAVEANEPLLRRLEERAIRFIRSTADRHKLPVTVAFSGGKDSLTVLLLVKKALTDRSFTVMFIDTGIEFPETLANVEEAATELGLKGQLIVKHVDPERFWRLLDKYGMVARDFRVCCKTIKLGPTTQLIDEHFPDGCLSFIGQRRYESRRRSQEGAVWRNPWVPKQVGASPIYGWTALMVWLYLLRERAPVNRLYTHGFDRIGCMFCPASTMSEFQAIAARYPERWERWYRVALRIARQKGLPEGWVKHGFWRWKKHPPKIRELAHQLGIPLQTLNEEIPAERLSYTILSKKEEGDPATYTVEGCFTHPIPLRMAAAFLPALGKVLFDSTLGIARIEVRGNNGGPLVCLLHQTGDFSISGPRKADLEGAAQILVKTVLRGVLCTGCGSCQTLCPRNAILLKDNRARIDPHRCNHCGTCLQGKCPTLYALHRTQ